MSKLFSNNEMITRHSGRWKDDETECQAMILMLSTAAKLCHGHLELNLSSTCYRQNLTQILAASQSEAMLENSS